MWLTYALTSARIGRLLLHVSHSFHGRIRKVLLELIGGRRTRVVSLKGNFTCLRIYVCCKSQVAGGWKAGMMKLGSIVVLLFSLAAPFAMGQRAASSGLGFEPLLRQPVLTDTNDEASQAMSDLLAITPDIPRGPLDLLQDYRDQMTLISQRFSVELDAIAQAVRNGQIRREDAEYLIQQGFQIAMMEYEVFRALHDSLASEVARKSVPRPQASSSSSSTVIVVDPPWARTSKNSASK